MLRVISLRFDPATGGFGDEALQEATSGGNLLAYHPYLIAHAGVPHLAVLLSLRDPEPPASSRPKPGRERRQAANPAEHDRPHRFPKTHQRRHSHRMLRMARGTRSSQRDEQEGFASGGAVCLAWEERLNRMNRMNRRGWRAERPSAWPGGERFNRMYRRGWSPPESLAGPESFLCCLSC
jgi:hypothetical protein